jgi:hypothetical protein
MNDKEILAGAPEGAIGIKIMNGFLRWILKGNAMSKIYACYSFNNMNQIYRSLSDIARIVELEQNLGLSRIALDHQKTLLVSCEAALSQRNSKIAELEKEIEAHERNDAANYKIMDDSSKEISELEKERDALFQLCNSALDQAFKGCSFDGDDIQDQASELGIITLTTFDPEKHENPSGELEEGDSYYEYAPWFLQIAKQLRQQAKGES